MIVTALLVRWENGWHEVNYPPGIAAWGRKEGTLGLGASKSITEVDTVSTQQLVYFADPRTEIAIDLMPRNAADTPIVAFNTADRIVVPDTPGRPPTREQVQAITATMDDDGRVTYAVELRDVLLDERERFAETLTKMANGTLGGDSKVAQPISTVGGVTTADCCPPAPPSGGFTVSTASPEATTYAGGGSDWLGSAPYGTNYTVDTFALTVPASHQSDGPPTKFDLWQHVPGGDGSYVVAEINLGTDHDAGTYHATGYFWGKDMIIDGANDRNLEIQGITQAEGFRAFVTFTIPGTEIVLDWANDS
jgi:hypothetical protein